MFAPLYLTLDDICHGLFKYPIIIISVPSACIRPKAGGLNKYQIKYFILRGHCGGRFGMWTKSSSTLTLSHRKLHSTSPQYDRFPRPFPTSNDKQTNPTESVSDPTMRTAFQNCVTIVRIGQTATHRTTVYKSLHDVAFDAQNGSIAINGTSQNGKGIGSSTETPSPSDPEAAPACTLCAS